MGGTEKYDANISFHYCHLLMPLCKILKGKNYHQKKFASKVLTELVNMHSCPNKSLNVFAANS